MLVCIPIAEFSVQTRTTGILLVTCFFHAVTFFAGTSYTSEPSWLPIMKLMVSQALSTSRYIIKSSGHLQPELELGEDDYPMPFPAAESILKNDSVFSGRLSDCGLLRHHYHSIRRISSRHLGILGYHDPWMGLDDYAG